MDKKIDNNQSCCLNMQKPDVINNIGFLFVLNLFTFSLRSCGCFAKICFTNVVTDFAYILRRHRSAKRTGLRFQLQLVLRYSLPFGGNTACLQLKQNSPAVYFLASITACAAASFACGILKGEQET